MIDSNPLKKLHFLSLIGLAYAGFIVAIYLLINQALTRTMEHQAISVAEIVAIQATSARTVYSREVVKKLSRDGFGPSVHSAEKKGYVPIPAQFLKKIGLESSKNTSELFYYRPVSQWNLEPSQGLNNDFLRWAWPQLQVQDELAPRGAIAWQPVWRIETDAAGERFLRYLKADPAAADSCVNCHNAYERKSEIIEQRHASGVATGKQWKKHQLLGALYVNIPLQKVEAIARTQNRETALFIILISIVGMILTSIFLRRSFKHRQSLDTLSHQASHDSLTGLINRRGFERYMDKIYDENKVENHANHVLCLMDLDGFKQVNDNYGHQAGDDLLVEIANTLRHVVRNNDLVARLGGDEFAVILDACPFDKAKQIATQILNAIKQCSMHVKGQQISVGVSIGLGMLYGDESQMDETIDAIDSACYAAKENGKHQVFYVEGEQVLQYQPPV